MTNAVALTITLELGTRRGMFGIPDLARAFKLDSDRVRELLLALLFAGPSVEACPHDAVPGFSQEEGDYRGRSFNSSWERNVHKYFSSDVPVGGKEGSGEPSGASANAPVDNVERFADYLAETLRDEKSLRFFSLVARHVPREVIRDALTKALDVPAREIRRSRGAIFASLVMPHLRRSRP